MLRRISICLVLCTGLAACSGGSSTPEPAPNPEGAQTEPAGASVVRGVAVHPANPSIVYAATWSGLYRSGDAGASWAAASEELRTVRFHTVAIDPKGPETVYAGAADEKGVYKTTDGKSWASARNGLTNGTVFALTVVNAPKPAVFAATNGSGIFRSEDGGASWSPVNQGLPQNPVVHDVGQTAPGTLFASVFTGGALKSTDGGTSWTATNNGLTLLLMSRIIAEPKAPRTLYAATFGGPGLFKSTDGGTTWAPSAIGITNPIVEDVLAAGGAVYAATQGGVFKSTDGGSSWTGANEGLPGGTFMLTIAADPKTPTTLYVGTNGQGLFKTTDGGTSWTKVSGSLGS